MLNYKCKSYRGKSQDKRVDALVIAKVMENKFTLTYAKAIPINWLQLCCHYMLFLWQLYTYITSLIFKTFYKLLHNGTVHQKHNFVDLATSVDTQAVESINNLIKCNIKNIQGVLTFKKEEFLNKVVIFSITKII